MTRFFKSQMKIGSLALQDDHYWRMADICFRHLGGAYENSRGILPHLWIREISNDNPKYGRSEYLDSLGKLETHKSEEYTQSLAAVVFCHVWVISTANYFRISAKEGNITPDAMGGRSIIKTVHSLDEIARQLDLPEDIIATARELKNARDTILHLVTSKNDSFPINEIDFKKAYQFAHCAWEIYITLMDHYGYTLDKGSWALQTYRFNLPSEIF